MSKPPRAAPRPPPLVIFDCDGVLVDSEPIAAATLAAELTRLGFPTTAADCLERYTGLSMAAMMRQIEDAWGQRLPADFRERLEELDYAAFRRALEPVAGIAAVVAALEEVGMAKCVASSGSLEKLELTLSHTGLMARFAPNVFSAEQVARGKPAPDLFLFAASRMGARARDCIVVEDSAAGVSAALAAGMKVVGFTGGGHAGDGYRRRLEQAGAPVVAAGADELIAVLTRSERL